MYVKLSLIILLVCLSGMSFGQDAPPPKYLLTQDFPDSVANLSISKLNGEELAFSEMLGLYAGKKIVIDLWASWCKDCIVGLPKLNKLMKKTGKNEVAYVFISLDEDEQKWKSAIKRFGINGAHYRVETGWNKTLANYIGLDWVPRYLVLDENGRVIMPKAISASDVLFKKALLE